MKTLIRKTITGSEYWCTKQKRTLFVPFGVKPNFKAMEQPKSMIDDIDLSNKKGINLDEMDADELIAFAEQNDMDIPGTMKKEDTIRKHIAEALAESK